jgi:hypothetical protein
MAEIDSAEFSEWLAFYQVDPFGEERADLRAGINSAVIANIHRGGGIKAFTAADFMPQFDRQEVTQTPEQMMAVMLAVDAAQQARRR